MSSMHDRTVKFGKIFEHDLHTFTETAPPPRSFEHDRSNQLSNISKLYIVGKRISRRLIFYLSIWKIFPF